MTAADKDNPDQKPRTKKRRWIKVDDWRDALARVHADAQSDILSDDVSDALDDDEERGDGF